MRLALLSALAEPSGRDGTSLGERPAFRRFAGKSVLGHQIDCAAHLECERVICLARSTGPDLAAAKSHAERCGLRFEIVDAPLRLQSLVTADDDVVLIGDGILPDRAVAVAALAERAAVLAFPEQPALASGFERLDATRAWSGVLRTRGDSVARLADLPPDVDLASALLRIALQSGVRVVELDPAPLTEGTWQRRVDRQAAPAAEWHWVARQVQLAPFAAPARAVVERLGLRWAQDAGGGRWARAPHGITLGAALSAAAAGFAGYPRLGLALVLAAHCGLAMARVFERVAGLGAPKRKPGRVFGVAGLALDGVLAALLSMQIMVVPSWLGSWLAIVLLALLWLGEAIAGPRLGALFGDRILLLALLIPLGFLGLATMGLAALIAAAVAAMLWRATSGTRRLTAD